MKTGVFTAKGELLPGISGRASGSPPHGVHILVVVVSPQMPDWLAPWLTPGLLVALFTWLRADMREMRRDIRDITARVQDLASHVSRLDGRIDGWQDHHRPAPPPA